MKSAIAKLCASVLIVVICGQQCGECGDNHRVYNIYFSIISSAFKADAATASTSNVERVGTFKIYFILFFEE